MRTTPQAGLAAGRGWPLEVDVGDGVAVGLGVVVGDGAVGDGAVGDGSGGLLCSTGDGVVGVGVGRSSSIVRTVTGADRLGGATVGTGAVVGPVVGRSVGPWVGDGTCVGRADGTCSVRGVPLECGVAGPPVMTVGASPVLPGWCRPGCVANHNSVPATAAARLNPAPARVGWSRASFAAHPAAAVIGTTTGARRSRLREPLSSSSGGSPVSRRATAFRRT